MDCTKLIWIFIRILHSSDILYSRILTQYNKIVELSLSIYVLVSFGSQNGRNQASVKERWLCDFSYGWLDGLSVICDQTGGRLRRIGWPKYLDDASHSWKSRLYYGVRAMLRESPQERDCNTVSSLGEETEALMVQSPRLEGDQSLIPYVHINQRFLK